MERQGNLATLEAKIRHIVETCASESNTPLYGWNYLYDEWYTINERMSSENLPCVMNITPPSGRLVQGKVGWRDEGDCIIGFAKKMDFDHDGTETDESMVQPCKEAAVQFLTAAGQSGLFMPIPEEITYSVIFDHLDCNVCVVAIQVRLQEREGYCTI